MTLIVDAGPLVALADATDPRRPSVRRLLREEQEQVVLPAPVSAEVDYLIGNRLGRAARVAFFQDMAEGRFQVVCLAEAEYRLLRT